MTRIIKLILMICFYGKSQFAQVTTDINVFPITNLGVYYINDKPKIIEGKLYNGIDTSYLITKDEKLLVIETFQEGYKIDLKAFYDNGQIETHFQWKNGLRDGNSKKWFKNGKIMFDDPMRNGMTIGATIFYYENGNIELINDRKAGVSMHFYENGKVKMLFKDINDSIFCKGKDAYEQTRWSSEGQLRFNAIENCGKQSFKYYYNDSAIESEGTQIDLGIFLVGKYSEYYQNGQKKLEGEYKDGNSQDEANVKIGIWKYFDESGRVTKEEYYENNELREIKYHSKNRKK